MRPGLQGAPGIPVQPEPAPFLLSGHSRMSIEALLMRKKPGSSRRRVSSFPTVTQLLPGSGQGTHSREISIGLWAKKLGVQAQSAILVAALVIVVE